jgi:ArsR family transcriptional regulator
MNNHVFKALADPTRREILRLLAKGEMNAGQLAARFDMTKPTVSHHFTVLKDADLVTSRREGQQIIYSLNTTVAQDVLTWLWDLFGSSSGEHQPNAPASQTLPAQRRKTT